MTLFFTSFIETFNSLCIICWYDNLNTKENTLDKIVKVVRKIAGERFGSLNHIFNKQLLNKAVTIWSGSVHPLHSQYKLSPSGFHLSAHESTKTGKKKTSISISNAGDRRRLLLLSTSLVMMMMMIQRLCQLLI